MRDLIGGGLRISIFFSGMRSEGETDERVLEDVLSKLFGAIACIASVVAQKGGRLTDLKRGFLAPPPEVERSEVEAEGAGSWLRLKRSDVARGIVRRRGASWRRQKVEIGFARLRPSVFAQDGRVAEEGREL